MNMAKPMTIEGTITRVGEVQTVGTKGFRKREFILEVGTSDWPNGVPFELHKDDADKPPHVGPATVQFYLQGREWQGRTFLSAKAVKVEQTAQPTGTTPAAPVARPDDDDQGLPF